jgi:ligand-binding SRPBCC domain-containing protein
MPVIELTTRINAPVIRVFDLSTSIELHMLSTKITNETAIAGKTTGLITLGETVTWRAKHFGVYQKLTVKITAFERPCFFVDEMQKGIFSSMKHTHCFNKMDDNYTEMNDIFEYQSPLGFVGKVFDFLILKNYMTKFLVLRNQEIKRIAESEEWKKLLGD